MYRDKSPLSINAAFDTLIIVFLLINPFFVSSFEIINEFLPVKLFIYSTSFGLFANESANFLILYLTLYL